MDPQNNRDYAGSAAACNSGEYAIPYLEKFEELGYGEVNLNIVSYGTVVSRKRVQDYWRRQNFRELSGGDLCGKTGQEAHFLFLVKTRSGMNCHEEWEELLEIYNQYVIHRS